METDVTTYNCTHLDKHTRFYKFRIPPRTGSILRRRARSSAEQPVGENVVSSCCMLMSAFVTLRATPRSGAPVRRRDLFSLQRTCSPELDSGRSPTSLWPAYDCTTLYAGACTRTLCIVITPSSLVFTHTHTRARRAYINPRRACARGRGPFIRTVISTCKTRLETKL